MQAFDQVSTTIGPSLSFPVQCGPYWLLVGPAPIVYPFVNPRRIYAATCYRHLVQSRHGLQTTVLNVRGLPGGDRATYNVTAIQEYMNQITTLPRGQACVIHCYHGVHRTGLIFCAALMQMEQLTMSQAWQIFCRIRPFQYPMRENIQKGLEEWAKLLRFKQDQKVK